MTLESTYRLRELARLTRVKPRAIRYWIERHLLAPPIGSGRSAHYTEEHLIRARAISKLQADGLPLIRIRQFLRSHTLDELRQFVGPTNDLPPAFPKLDGHAVPELAADADDAARGSLWELLLFRRGIVLLCGRDEPPEVWRVVQEMFRTYRPILARIKD